VSLWRVVAWAFLASVALIVALVLAGSDRGLALLAYVLFLTGVGLLALSRALRDQLRRAPRFEQLALQAAEPNEPIAQFETLSRMLSAARWNQSELHFRLRPAVREIVNARLSRRYGVDLEREPEQAHKLLGEGRAWELVRPDRKPPVNHFAPGWSRLELKELFDELEEAR